MVDRHVHLRTLRSYRVRHAPCDMRTSACKSVYICLFRKTFLASPCLFFLKVLRCSGQVFGTLLDKVFPQGVHPYLSGVHGEVRVMTLLFVFMQDTHARSNTHKRAEGGNGTHLSRLAHISVYTYIYMHIFTFTHKVSLSLTHTHVSIHTQAAAPGQACLHTFIFTATC